MGDILDLARRDAAMITNAGGFDVDITFKESGGDVVVKGTSSKHHLAYDETGQRVSSKNAEVTVNEADLIAAGITVRNTTGEVDLRRKVISVADSTGNQKTYVVRERFPDETLGIIVLILGDYKE